MRSILARTHQTVTNSLGDSAGFCQKLRAPICRVKLSSAEPYLGTRRPEGRRYFFSWGPLLFADIQEGVRQKFRQAIHDLFSLQVDAPTLGFPPSPEMGEISITSCFDLAKQLRQPPRKIAGQVVDRLLPLAGVERATIAGPGYINLHLDRAAVAADVFLRRSSRRQPRPLDAVKVLVEHTSINPNKAAHIGHLRNAVLGDTLARLLRFRGWPVEVQNYIDNTGVQVADVVVGFMALEKKTVQDLRHLIADQSGERFDYVCWDLYARVSQHYGDHPEEAALRLATLKALEDGEGEAAEMATLISTTITRSHIATAERLNVRYDLLVQESEILRLEFWKSAFELMKKSQAIRLEDSGKNSGCWVMDLQEQVPDADEGANGEDVKVIVRSNGTVTYVGKDIAYHLWKFALLGKDFGYERFHRYPDGAELWRTAVHGEPNAPAFGHGGHAYAVIDTRQSYLQDVVRRAFLALGYAEQAANLRHFAYEVVGLSPRCAKDLGVGLGEEDRSYVEVSGRKGVGIKADDLIDTLFVRALEEVRSRDTVSGEEEQVACARQIAVGALRYFLLKYTRRTLIAFDFKDALAFEGETGPYLQYSVVRARNIFRKFREAHPGYISAALPEADLHQYLAAGHGQPFWDLVLLASQLEMAVEQAISTEEPAALAKYCFRLAQAFNNFYHHHRILQEPDPARQNFLLFLTHTVAETLTQALDLLGIQVPDRM